VDSRPETFEVGRRPRGEDVDPDGGHAWIVDPVGWRLPINRRVSRAC
jgi:hypothetical protein